MTDNARVAKLKALCAAQRKLIGAYQLNRSLRVDRERRLRQENLTLRSRLDQCEAECDRLRAALAAGEEQAK